MVSGICIGSEMDHRKEENRKNQLHLALIALQKAYDNIPRSMMWAALEDTDIEMDC